jgi:hypothetical protein
MRGRNCIHTAFCLQVCRLALTVVAITAVTGTVFGAVLVDYPADTLPPPPWEFINNGPPQEISQHTVFVQNGVLHMIDNALLVGNTLGFLQHVPFDPDQILEVQFRARVLSGESALDERAPFQVWLYNGTVRADLSVGPQSITALGGPEHAPTIILNESINGTDWHVYRYRLDPRGIQWWVDGISVGSATIEMLIPHLTDVDRRINMFITSATANVELDYLVVSMTPPPLIIEVAIDIKPGSDTNRINLKSKGVVPVAIFTTDTFDATAVDPLSVEFGPNGATEAHGKGHIKDADGDGNDDLVLHFNTQETGIQCGDTSASLTGQTSSGQGIEGTDTIQTAGCK